mgnify:FL=1
MMDFAQDDRTKTLRQVYTISDNGGDSNSGSSDSSGDSRKKRKWRGNEQL